jgi:glutamate racemase
VVLGCTHYPLLLDELRLAAPWPVEFIDPAPAIARRVREVANAAAAAPPRRSGAFPPGTVLFTARRGEANEALAAYARFGFETAELLDLPARETV